MVKATKAPIMQLVDNSGDLIDNDTSSIDGKIPDKGTAVMTGSMPITIATDDVVSTNLVALAANIAAIIAGSTPAVTIVSNPDRASIFEEQAFNAQAEAGDATVAGLAQVTSLGFEAQLAGFTGILTAWSTLDGTTKLAQLRFKKEGTIVDEINSTTETANYSCAFEDDFMHQVILSMTRTAGSVSATIFGKGV